MIYIFFFFFFSSRRRHTRLTCDWSSDVCSSDLVRDELGRRLDLSARLDVDENLHRVVANENARGEHQRLQRRPATAHTGSPPFVDALGAPEVTECKGSAGGRTAPYREEVTETVRLSRRGRRGVL